ncbi:DMT family transporter [Rhodovulum sp. PH10]|uniref:DMT family transporter n=1 Tax=Rhodovulum sp. PH10 TaxID=1187851 RepID=UPI000590C15D|nr:DMT family transporter [Rhodovulum sp. PH10]
MRATPLTMSPLDWVMLIALSTLWGGSYFFAKIAVAEVPPLTIALVRVAIAAPILLALCGATVRRGLPRHWLAFLVMGLLSNAAPYALIAWSQTRIGSGIAAILNTTTPLFAIVLAHLFTHDDRITPARTVGLLLGIAGVAVMVGPTAVEGLGGEILAETACLAASACYALGAVYTRRYRTIAPDGIAGGQTLAASLLLAGPALLIDRPWTLPVPSLGATAAVLALGAVSTALAYVMYFRILARAGATNALLVTFLAPVSAVLLGAVLLGERLESYQIAGMLGIAAGLVAIDGRLVRRLFRGGTR